MLAVSDAAERVLKEHVPAALKAQCGDIAKIHNRLDAAAFLMEAWIADGQAYAAVGKDAALRLGRPYAACVTPFKAG